MTKEQQWAALRATMVLPTIQSWENAITQHTERDYAAVREMKKLQGTTRTSGWRKNEIKRRRA